MQVLFLLGLFCGSATNAGQHTADWSVPGAGNGEWNLAANWTIDNGATPRAIPTNGAPAAADTYKVHAFGNAKTLTGQAVTIDSLELGNSLTVSTDLTVLTHQVPINNSNDTFTLRNKATHRVNKLTVGYGELQAGVYTIEDGTLVAGSMYLGDGDGDGQFVLTTGTATIGNGKGDGSHSF